MGCLMTAYEGKLQVVAWTGYSPKNTFLEVSPLNKMRIKLLCCLCFITFLKSTKIKVIQHPIKTKHLSENIIYSTFLTYSE